MRLLTFIAVAALAATAMSFPAFAYCRGCVIEEPAAKAALASADVTTLPAIKIECHTEKHRYWKNGERRIRRVEICE